jgi:hypothetical protein
MRVAALAGARAGAQTGIDGVLSAHGACPGTIANQLLCNDEDSSPAATTRTRTSPSRWARVSRCSSASRPSATTRSLSPVVSFIIHAAFAACGSADFNCDGDIGTDADIEAFFRVLAGGSC